MAKQPEIKLTPKQRMMIIDLAEVDEVFWGGQAGGGKSEGLLMFALIRRLQFPGSAGLMMRKTFPDLDRSLIRKSFNYFQPFAKWNESKHHWKFKNGSIQEAGYCERDKDVYMYQSAEYDDIVIDELSHFSEFQYLYMMSRLRGRGDWKTLMRSASNPGNIGHLWVKARFVDCARDKMFKSVDAVLSEEAGRPVYKTRYFVPAALGDNTLRTPAQRLEYKSWLAQLPEDERKMLMDGDWDYMPGAAFSELHRDNHSYDPKEIPVPTWAKIFMSYDFGFGKPFSIGWWWIDYDGRMWRFAEWYGWNGKPDQGLRLALSKVAEGIDKREKLLGIEKRVNYRVAGHDIFAKTPNVRGGGQGPSIAEVFSEHGIFFTPGDPDRMLGKQQVHERMKIPEVKEERPMMMVSTDCTQWWRTFPVLILDDNNIEDIDTDQEDHIYDETKIACMSRPISPKRMKPELNHIEKIMKKVQTPNSGVDNELEMFDYNTNIGG